MGPVLLLGKINWSHYYIRLSGVFNLVTFGQEPISERFCQKTIPIKARLPLELWATDGGTDKLSCWIDVLTAGVAQISRDPT